MSSPEHTVYFSLLFDVPSAVNYGNNGCSPLALMAVTGLLLEARCKISVTFRNRLQRLSRTWKVLAAASCTDRCCDEPVPAPKRSLRRVTTERGLGTRPYAISTNHIQARNLLDKQPVRMI